MIRPMVRYVSVDKVRPLVLWLETLYPRGLKQVAEAHDIPYKTLQSIKTDPRQRNVARPVALKIVEAVKEYRHGQRRWSIYENDGSPRFATKEEKLLPKTFSRWRAADD